MKREWWHSSSTALAVFVASMTSASQGPLCLTKGADGNPPNAPVTELAMSRDGLVVAFVSKATNLVEGKAPETALYIHTLTDAKTRQVRSSPAGTSEGQRAVSVALSPDGGYVAYITGSGDAVLYDRISGTRKVLSAERDARMGPCAPSLGVSTGGSAVVLTAPLLGSGDEHPSCWLWEPHRGRVEPLPVKGHSEAVAITPDGRYILLLATFDGKRLVVRYDRTANVHVLVSVDSEENAAKGDCTAAAISDDGNLIAFISRDDGLASGATKGVANLYVRDMAAGTTECYSSWPRGVEPSSLAMSGDGRHIAFLSVSPSLPGAGRSNAVNVFVLERATKKVRCVSVASSGSRADGNCSRPVMDGSGSVVAFLSSAKNLVPGLGGTQMAFAAGHKAAGAGHDQTARDRELRRQMDFSGDGKVGQADLELLKAKFGSNDPRYDLNGDGSIDLRDLNLLLQHMEEE